MKSTHSFTKPGYISFLEASPTGFFPPDFVYSLRMSVSWLGSSISWTVRARKNYHILSRRKARKEQRILKVILIFDILPSPAVTSLQVYIPKRHILIQGLPGHKSFCHLLMHIHDIISCILYAFCLRIAMDC